MTPWLPAAGFLLLTWFAATSSAEDYPVAKWASGQPGVVISPFDPERLLDVSGLKPGGLAEDPAAQKIFRIPLNSPSPAALPGKPAKAEGNRPPDPAGTGDLPPDLAAFVRDFNASSSFNDPRAVLPFFANPVENYFGSRNMTHEKILADRAAYLRRFPQREYSVEGSPVLLSQKGNACEVLSQVRYQVKGDSGIRSGVVSHHYKVRQVSPNDWKIFSIAESRHRAAGPGEIEAGSQAAPPDSAPPPAWSGGSPYRDFQLKEIKLFLEAFLASGESNEPEAVVEFLAPGVTQYYELQFPDEEQLLQDRRTYIQRWPHRRYWVAQQPEIAQSGDGTWEVLARTGWQVDDGSTQKSGVARERIRLCHTSAGLKIFSIRPE